MPGEMRQSRRLEIIEEIISGGRICRDDLLHLVNQRVEASGDAPITLSQLDKDIKAMRRVYNAQILSFKGRNPGYEYAPGAPRKFANNLAPLTRQQVHELNFAVDILHSKADLPLLRDGLEMINRIVNQRLQQMGRHHIMTDPSHTTPVGERFITLLYDAIKNRKAVIIDYQKLSDARASTRTFSPYLLREHRGFWYVIGYNHNSGDGKPAVIILGMDRVRDIRPANAYYHEDTEFSPESYFRHSLGIWHEQGQEPAQISFWASEKISHFLEVRKHHHSQARVRKMEMDGRSGYKYKMTVFLSDEVVNLFLEWGDQIKAIEPQALVDKVREKAKAISTQYDR